jgi:hypothetical protein
VRTAITDTFSSALGGMELADRGKVKVGVEVTYTPDGGEPEEQIATLRLKR